MEKTCKTCRFHLTGKCCDCCWPNRAGDAPSQWQPKEDTVKYRVLKEISLLTIAQAGPKGCKEFSTEWKLLIEAMGQMGWVVDWSIYSPVTDAPLIRDFISWAEVFPRRIAWLIEKGFIEKVEPELKPCPFHQGDKSLVVVDEDRDGFYIRCKFCYARGPNTPMKTDAINGWNYRA